MFRRLTRHPAFQAAAARLLGAYLALVFRTSCSQEKAASALGSHGQNLTAALTGADALYDAVFKQYGVIRVQDYDELLETCPTYVEIVESQRSAEGAAA